MNNATTLRLESYVGTFSTSTLVFLTAYFMICCSYLRMWRQLKNARWELNKPSPRFNSGRSCPSEFNSHNILTSLFLMMMMFPVKQHNQKELFFRFLSAQTQPDGDVAERYRVMRFTPSLLVLLILSCLTKLSIRALNTSGGWGSNWRKHVYKWKLTAACVCA